MLIKKLNFDIPDKIIGELIVINTFNMEARYPDEKYDFSMASSAFFSSLESIAFSQNDHYKSIDFIVLLNRLQEL